MMDRMVNTETSDDKRKYPFKAPIAAILLSGGIAYSTTPVFQQNPIRGLVASFWIGVVTAYSGKIVGGLSSRLTDKSLERAADQNHIGKGCGILLAGFACYGAALCSSYKLSQYIFEKTLFNFEGNHRAEQTKEVVSSVPTITRSAIDPYTLHLVG